MKQFKASILCIALILSFCTSTVIASDALPAATDEVLTTQTVATLVDRLEEANGIIPSDFTKAEMDIFLAEADPEDVSNILNKIIEHSTPIPMPTVNSTYTNAAQCRSETYREYDIESGIETIHSFSEHTSNAFAEASASYDLTSAASETVSTIYAYDLGLRAYPEYWTESSPQSYSDCRSTCKIIIKSGLETYVGSGFLVDGNTMLTASHCVYNPKFDNGYADYIVVMPSYSDSSILGYYGNSTSISYIVGNYYTVPTYNRGDDWGIVTLNKDYCTSTNGSLTLDVLNLISFGNNSHINKWIRTQGYPDENPQTGAANENLYLTTGVGLTDYSAYFKVGTAKSYPGMSGGPVLMENSSGVVGYGGIISGGDTDTGYVGYVAFDANLINTIQYYAQIG